jgi:hypothetical protein
VKAADVFKKKEKEKKNNKIGCLPLLRKKARKNV